MKKTLIYVAVATILAAVTVSIDLVPLNGVSAQAMTVESNDTLTLPEGHDFATLHLQDPWDMSEFTDISQGINLSGDALYLQDINVGEGVFSAKSTDTRDAQFFPLWPGFNTMILVGKLGHNSPIDANTFQCLYLGMKVNSDAGTTLGYPDQFQIMWFADELLNGAGGIWGYSKGIVLYPEAGMSTPEPTWKLYKVDLASDDTYWGGTRWTDQNTWQGLRIDPTLQANVGFEVDWVRLTDCNAVLYPISWNGSQAVSIWIRPPGTYREILVESNVQSSPYDLDVQGIPPGDYTYLVKQNDQVLTSGSFKINQTPIGQFTQPSFTSGKVYEVQAGKAWNMDDANDVRWVDCAESSMQNSVLSIDTPSVENQPASCNGGDVSDPKIYLNSAMPANTNQYRYLSFRIYTALPYQDVGHGTIARWIWSIQGNSGRQGFRCHLVSQDIPYDVGWQTVSVDMFDAFNGSSEAYAGECPGNLHWLNSNPVLEMRFDPNENISGIPVHQELDWISLNQVDSVVRGTPFPIQIAFNKPPEEITQITFYYTDDLLDPTQHRVLPYETATGSPAGGEETFPQDHAFRVYLPLTTYNYYKIEYPPVTNGVNYAWSTSGVSPGEYYICTFVEDEYNGAMYCSEAPVQVTTN